MKKLARHHSSTFLIYTLGLILLASFLFYHQEEAYGNEQTVIKVGYYDNPPKLFLGAQNKPSGIFPEIVDNIAQKEGWKIKWVPGTWKEGLARLESGEIDVMPDVAYSIQRAEKYEFADEPVLINWAVLYTREGIHVNSLLDLAGKKIAVMRGSIHTEGQEGIKVLVRKFRIHCTFIEYDSYSEVFLALQNNLADVGVVNRLFGLTSQKLYDVLPTSIVFNPRHLRFAFPLHGTLTPYLKKTIDRHLKAAAENPDSIIQHIIQSYLTGIPREYLNERTPHKIFLTNEEKAWIAAHPTIRLGIDPEFAPFEFIDDNGQYSGYASDYIRLLNERLGLNMEVISGHSWKEVVAMAEKGEIDVLPVVGYTEDRSRFLKYTIPYVGFFRMIFCQADAPFISGIQDLRNLKVAVQAKSSHAGWINDNTDIDPVYYDSLEETIRAVSEGKADVFIGNLAASTYWIRKLNITNLQAAAPVSLQRQLLHMAVREDWPILVDILNKGLASISSEVAEDIRNRWTAAGYTIGISPWVFWRRIGLTLLSASLLIAFLWFWNRRLQREVTLRKEAESDLLLIKEELAERVKKKTHHLTAEISERKRIEQKFIQQNAEFQSIFNSITDAIVFVDVERRILMINPAFTSIFGYELEEVKGKTTQFFYADPDEYHQQGNIRFHKEARVKTPVYEIDYRRKDGSNFTSETLGVPVKDKNEEIIGYLGIIRDISQKKKTEKEKTALEVQLRQAHKMEAVGTLAGGIAHDFNNILAIILGNAELAKINIPTDNAASVNIDQILSASNRAKSLIKRLLTFSRKEKGEKGLHSLCHLIDESMETIRSTMPKSIKLEGNISLKCEENIDDSFMINADPTQINQLLMNLCVNAVDAMDEVGTLTIAMDEVTFKDDDIPANRQGIRPGIYEYLSISDTGHGMSPELLERIFDPFFTTKDVGKGTGIGLSVVQGIIKNHDGYIFIESAIDQGTTFHIYFPVASKIKPEAEFNEDLQLPTGSERVLFVDDEEMLVQVGKTILEQLGYTVTAKTSSTEALELFQDDPHGFDLVITDQAMPTMPGSELAKQLLGIRPDIPIILCTGYSSKVDKEKAEEIGIREFALKPLDNKEISILIRKVLEEGA